MDPEPASTLLNLNWSATIGVISLVALLILSAMISGTEVAFFSLSKSDLEDKDLDEKKYYIVKLLKNPKKLLASILIANNFINILFILLFAYLGDLFFSGINSDIVKFLIEIILVTFLILLFGEVLPKVYANRNSYKFALAMAKPMGFLNSFLSLLSLPLLKLTSIVEKRLSKKQSDFSNIYRFQKSEIQEV